MKKRNQIGCKKQVMTRVTHQKRQPRRRKNIEAAEFLQALQRGDPLLEKEVTEEMVRRDNEIFREIEQEMGGVETGTSEGGDEIIVLKPKKRPLVENVCRGCGKIAGPAHKCDLCGSNMHPFCGIPIGEEGHGQTIRC